MRLNNWSIAASYDTARILAGLGFRRTLLVQELPRTQGLERVAKLRTGCDAALKADEEQGFGLLGVTLEREASS